MFFYSLQMALGYNVKELVNKNWNIKEHKLWKASEQLDIKPNNQKSLNGVRLICDEPKEYSSDVINLVVYTDIETQYALAELKGAYWFHKKYSHIAGTLAEIRKNAVMYNGVEVNNNSIITTDGPNEHKFLLQDVVKSKFKCVTDALGLQHTQNIADHVDRWVALHPRNIQELFYTDI